MYNRACALTQTHTHSHSHTQTHTNTRTFTHSHTHTRLRTHTQTFIYVFKTLQGSKYNQIYIPPCLWSAEPNTQNYQKKPQDVVFYFDCKGFLPGDNFNCVNFLPSDRIKFKVVSLLLYYLICEFLFHLSSDIIFDISLYFIRRVTK